MKSFYIISNRQKDEGDVLLNQVRSYLEERGASCQIHYGNGEPDPSVQCVITLGGDGTLLRVVRRLADRQLAFIGINTGTLGYLTEGEQNNVPAILDALLSDQVIREERIMIYGRVLRDGKAIARHRALNDVVVGRGNTMKMANLRVNVNQQMLKDYRCDALIASTPTGSTAYSFSAGGPIVEPTARLFLLTPVAAHSLNDRSIVFPATDQLSVELLPGSRGNESGHYQVVFDGEKPVELQVGDRVEITQATTIITILKLSERSFVETLSKKLSD